MLAHELVPLGRGDRPADHADAQATEDVLHGLEPHRIAIDYDRCLVLRWVHRKGRLSIRLASLNFGSSKIADLATIEKGSRLFF